MSSEMNVNDQNRMAVMLMQALWGAISPNFRMVALCLSGPIWKIWFVLENDDPDDREEIEDVAADFDALQDNGSATFNVEITVTDEPLQWPKPPWVVVFRRRENG